MPDVRTTASGGLVLPAGAETRIHPRFRNDSVYFAASGGVVLRSDSGSLFLEGGNAYELARRLVPSLTGSASLRQVCDAASPQERGPVEGLIRLMIERGIVEDRAVPVSSPATLERQFDLLTRLVADPCEAFDRFRRSGPLIAGGGTGLATCVMALAGAGLERMVLASASCPGIPDGLQDACAAAGCALESVDDACRSVPDHPLVIYCADQPHLGAITALNRSCSTWRRPLLVASALETRGIMGPWLSAARGGCWLCSLARSAGEVLNRDVNRVLRALRSNGGDSCGLAVDVDVARVVGREAAFEAFKFLLGADRLQTVDQVIVLTADAIRTVPTTLTACIDWCSTAMETAEGPC